MNVGATVQRESSMTEPPHVQIAEMMILPVNPYSSG
jgi:hypothetical protein